MFKEVDLAVLKFIYSEKATKFCEISTVDLSYICSNGQITVEISQNFVVFTEYMNFTFKKMIKIAETTFIVIKPNSRLFSFSVTFDGTNRLKVLLKFGYFSVKWKSFHKNLYCWARGPSIYYVSKVLGFLAPSSTFNLTNTKCNQKLLFFWLNSM